MAPQHTLLSPRPEVKNAAASTSGVNSTGIYPGYKKMVIGRAMPFESDTKREEIKARAVRDIQLAHTKDVHGN